jgi:hypothetical protein
LGYCALEEDFNRTAFHGHKMRFCGGMGKELSGGTFIFQVLSGQVTKLFFPRSFHWKGIFLYEGQYKSDVCNFFWKT